MDDPLRPLFGVDSRQLFQEKELRVAHGEFERLPEWMRGGALGQPPTGGPGGLMVVGTGGSIYVGVPVGEPPYYGGAGGAPADEDFGNP